MTDRYRDDERRQADEEPRVRRQDSARQEPIRNWWNLFRSGKRSDGDAPPGGNGRSSWSAPIDRGVRLSYEMLDEQIRQGQRVAQEINNRSYGIDSMNRDFQELAVRSMRYYMDAASLFMDFFSTLPKNMGSAPFGPQPPKAGGSTGNPDDGGEKGGTEAAREAGGSVPVATRVRSTRPATVTVDLKSSTAGRPLRIAALHATENGAPPITTIRFVASAGNGCGPLVEIEVPEEQPVGLYAGVLIDPQTGEPGGTISLRLEA